MKKGSTKLHLLFGSRRSKFLLLQLANKHHPPILAVLASQCANQARLPSPLLVLFFFPPYSGPMPPSMTISRIWTNLAILLLHHLFPLSQASQEEF